MNIHYYPLINKALTSLRLRDVDPSEANLEKSFIKPFITVAREPGSGGAPIARAVAKKIGFTLVDEQIVDEIAKSTKKKKDIIRQVDEKSRSRIQDMIYSVLNEEYITDLRYMRALTKVLLTYAAKGHVVILGRGANFITPFAKGLHVNIVAPYKIRVERAMDFEGLNKTNAKKVIAEVEQERRNFVKQYLSKDPKKSNSYDLTLNTSYFKVDEARDIILEAFYKKFNRSLRYGVILK